MTQSTVRQRLLRFLYGSIGATAGLFAYSWLTSKAGEPPQYWFLIFGPLFAVQQLLPESFHAKLNAPLSARGAWLAILIAVTALVTVFSAIVASVW